MYLHKSKAWVNLPKFVQLLRFYLRVFILSCFRKYLLGTAEETNICNLCNSQNLYKSLEITVTQNLETYM